MDCYAMHIIPKHMDDYQKNSNDPCCKCIWFPNKNTINELYDNINCLIKNLSSNLPYWIIRIYKVNINDIKY